MYSESPQYRTSHRTKSETTGTVQPSISPSEAQDAPAELGTAQLQALRSSPLYSPQTSRAKAAQARHVSTQRSCPFETTFNNKERRFPMYNGDRRPLISSEFRHMDILSDADDQRLTIEVECLYEKLLPLPDDLRRKQDLVAKLERLLNQQWPGKDFTVHAFGSSENSLATRTSDLDVCIETEWAGFGQQVCQLSHFLSQCGMEKVVCRAQAKVPVVTIYDPELRISCDMNINNMLALRNTKLVKTYVQIDVRARKLIFAIKQWASNRALNEAVCNTLTSYTWTLLIINYLQTRKSAPVLPSLQDWPHEPMPPMDGIDVSFADDIDKYDTLQTFSMQNTESVGQLLFGFFHYYSYVFNYNRDVASVRRGRVLNRKEKGYPGDNMFCIEEPFTITRNLGNTADMGSFKGILSELQRAHRLLANGESLSVVFAKYDPSKINNYPTQNPYRQPKRPTTTAKKSNWNNGGRQSRPPNGPNQGNNMSTHGFYQPRSDDHNLHGGNNSVSAVSADVEPSISNRDQLQWQYVTMAEHNRLVLNSNPYLYPAQLMQYAEAYCKNDLRHPPTMQRAKSVPINDPALCSWNFGGGRRMSETLRSGPRGRAFYNSRSRHDQMQAYHMPQFTVSESELSRPTYGTCPGSDLATALGLRQIEMIPQNRSPGSVFNRENLLHYDANFNGASRSEVSQSDTADTPSSIAMTLASSRSSPNSISDFSTSGITTYAQVSSKALDTLDRTSSTMPGPNVNNGINSTVTSHFTKPGTDCETLKQSPPAMPVTYAAKASTPARSVQSKDQAIPRAGH